MTLEALDNLVQIRRLNKEPTDQNQFDGMVKSAKTRLLDIEATGLSEEGRFVLAYGAAHSLALAALRWHGYRSDNRYMVFQCLQHTVGLEAAKWRVLDKCHNLRNQAEYEGMLDISRQLLEELIDITMELVVLVEALGSVT